MYISEIRIQGFKRFEDATFSFNEGLNVVVGDNDSGKSTLLEAISIAVDGQYRGLSITRALSENLFNQNTVGRYLANIERGERPSPPEIVIEIEFCGSDEDTAPYRGDANYLRREASGIVFKAALDEDAFSEDYSELLNSGYLTGVPIEYYLCSWTSFARKAVRPASIKYRTTLIGSALIAGGAGSKAYVSKITKDVLDYRDQIAASQLHRRLMRSFEDDPQVHSINEKISQELKSLTGKSVSLGFDVGTLNSWESAVVALLENVPFANAGDGTKRIIGTELALARNISKHGIVLLEEPENHLSHSRLNMFLEGVRGKLGSSQILVTTHSSFVANKLELRKLTLINGDRSVRLSSLQTDTSDFFMKAPGYKTLRLLLCRFAVLVEGDADELVFQKAYMASHNGKLPIQEGIEVISVGTSARRFLEVSRAIGKPTIALIDNDGDIGFVRKRYEEYPFFSEAPGEGPVGDQLVCCPCRLLPEGNNPKVNYNTLESELYESMGYGVLGEILGRDMSNRDEALRYMETHKTEVALKIFDSEQDFGFPEYIIDAIGWLDRKDSESECV